MFLTVMNQNSYPEMLIKPKIIIQFIPNIGAEKSKSFSTTAINKHHHIQRFRIIPK